MPVVSTLNSLDGRTKANAAIVPAGTSERVSVYASNTTDLFSTSADTSCHGSSGTGILPINAVSRRRYARRERTARRPSAPERAATRIPGPSGHRLRHPQRCASVLARTVTALPKSGTPLGYLTAWPAGQGRPGVSTLNAPTGTQYRQRRHRAAGTAGDIMAYAIGNSSDLLIDINGYFAAANQRHESHVAV